METFTKLFGSLLVFVYHCFDRLVIHGYLSGLSRLGQVVHFFHDVVGEPVIDKAVLSRRTNEYQGWVEFSFIYETGEHEMDAKGLPETSTWAVKEGCGARV